MIQLRAGAVIAFSLIALFFALPASASPPSSASGSSSPSSTASSTQSADPSWFATGMHANEVEPLVRGVVAQGVQVMAFATCFVALDKNDTCVDVATRAKNAIEPAAQLALGRAPPKSAADDDMKLAKIDAKPSATLARR